MTLYKKIFNLLYPPLKKGDVVRAKGMDNNGVVLIVYGDDMYRVMIPTAPYATAYITYKREQLKLIRS